LVNGDNILQVAAPSADAKMQWYAAISESVGECDIHTHPLGTRAYEK
jgi:hypothetical protein